MERLHLADVKSVGGELSLKQDLNQLAMGTTWLERLYMNLLSYSVVLLPITLIVLATRYRLFPSSIISSSLIQWFVYGSDHNESNSKRDLDRKSLGNHGDRESLLDDRLKIEKQQSSKHRKNESRASFEFLVCLIGLQVSYLIWGWLQEKIMTTNYPVTTLHKQSIPSYDLGPSSRSSSNSSGLPSGNDSGAIIQFHDSQFLVFINRVVAFVAAILALVFTRHYQVRSYADRFSLANNHSLLLKQQDKGKPSAPLYEYIYCSLSNILSSWCQYEALKFVDFPTQCLSKSCKVIPVMVMSKIILRKRYSTLDYLCAFLLALGMFIFMLNQPIGHHQSKEGTFNGSRSSLNSVKESSSRIVISGTLASGLIILALYLTFDSFTSNWQQSLYSRYSISNWQMMAASNFYSILLTLTSLYQLGKLEPAIRLLSVSTPLMRDCMIMSVMSSIGQMFVYYTIKRFGSVIFTVIMTLRQFLSILLSCAIYDHKLSSSSSLGLVIVFSVVGFQSWHKSKSKSNPKEKSTAQDCNLPAAILSSSVIHNSSSSARL